MSSRGAGIAGNPVLIGAATVLVVLVAVFLAYNANQGLPFVPTYTLKAEVPSAANLVRGNEVRIGGSRVGTVDSITAAAPGRRRERRACSGSSSSATPTPLPKDSTLLIRAEVRARPQVRRAHARDARDDGFGDGDTIPLTAATPRAGRVRRVREHVRRRDARRRCATNLDGFGDAFAGRGVSLNQAIAAFRPLLRDIVPVARNLSDPDTHLKRFVADARRRRRASVAPAAEDAGASCSSTSTRTIAALREVARPFIQDSITEGRPALDEAIRSFPIQRPFLATARACSASCARACARCAPRRPILADALEIGTPTLRALGRAQPPPRAAAARAADVRRGPAGAAAASTA